MNNLKSYQQFVNEASSKYQSKKQRVFDQELALKQRGKPEYAMLKVQKIAGGGVLSTTSEHVGDLTHRMSEWVTFNDGGFGSVKDKVEKTIRWLSSGYGFEREMNENIRNNAKFRNVDESELRNQIQTALKRYAKEHSKLPVFNQVQELARDAAVKLGEMKFDQALRKLRKLQNHLDKGKEHWVTVAHRVTKNKSFFN